MAAISIINNGEAMSSVRSKLNNVITEINLLDPTDWVDYSSTSTIVGWSSFTTKIIRYRIIGKQVFVRFYLEGTSNSTSTTFTLPNNNINIIHTANSYNINNGAFNTSGGYSYIPQNSNVCTGLVAASPTWVSSGSKSFIGQFFYEIA